LSRSPQDSANLINAPCGCNSVVECQLPKLNVAGSSPVTRFILRPLNLGRVELDQSRIGPKAIQAREICLTQPRGLISCKTWGPVAAIRRSPSKAAMMKRAAWGKSPCSAAKRARTSSARIETRNLSRASAEGAANEEVRAGLVKMTVISTVSIRE
jgi:hypothetical protein